ncbi:uncharacterized protein BDZ83DRAFT_655383 [Colletotrichum acutatum]|uniref:Uncharacterized protein n=1 Tax=Glomerella acutata TaxID=27357 RepID=A0AAD8UFS3_GLOAC|nr:uncharacterized protein BDZ83DRAFT_655383 [Colletotrichum acutatum]KAK1716838.1 hypothetical protein BDZ83DRAFT_655383 [Colletotrichum acutatum]
MLSSLPSLKHLALRDCIRLEGDSFPHLPSLVEAHFYHCELPENEIFERRPSLKVLVIDNDYCLEDEDTEVCDVNPLADTVETCGWLVEEPAPFYYPLRQFRRVKHLKVDLIHDLFGALPYEIIPSYDGLPNLAATVETIEFTSRITSRVTGGDPNAHALYYRNWQKSMEELRYTINMMEECCRKEWRKVRLIDISMLALSYRRERSGYDVRPTRDSIKAEGLQLLECAKRRFQQELGIELLIL